MTAMNLHRYPSPSGGFALGKMGAGATMLKQGKTARDYVQNGLVAMWDGIENAGWGVHDASATTFEELVSGTACKLTGSISTNYEWTNNALMRKSTNRGYFDFDATSVLQTAARNATFTVECVTSSPVESANWQAQIFNLHTIAQTSYAAGIIARWRRENNGTTGGLYGATYYANGGYTISPIEAAELCSCVLNGETLVVYSNGSVIKTNQISPGATIEGVKIRLGSLDYGFRGLYHALRVYSRALTADEIAANYAIDQERFNLS